MWVSCVTHFVGVIEKLGLEELGKRQETRV